MKTFLGILIAILLAVFTVDLLKPKQVRACTPNIEIYQDGEHVRYVVTYSDCHVGTKISDMLDQARRNVTNAESKTHEAIPD